MSNCLIDDYLKMCRGVFIAFHNSISFNDSRAGHYEIEESYGKTCPSALRKTVHRLGRLPDHKKRVRYHIISMRHNPAFRLKPQISHGLRNYHPEKYSGEHVQLGWFMDRVRTYLFLLGCHR
jgi:hypothetical protein